MARTNGIELCYEIFGDAAAEPLLLIMGLGAHSKPLTSCATWRSTWSA
jgi:hypothetical protein